MKISNRVVINHMFLNKKGEIIMKSYSKEVYVFEFSKEDIANLEKIMGQVVRNITSEDQDILIEEINDSIYSILHP